MPLVLHIMTYNIYIYFVSKTGSEIHILYLYTYYPRAVGVFNVKLNEKVIFYKKGLPQVK